MRFFPFLAASTFFCSVAPSHAQVPLEAPAGWTTQTRANGATTFSPPDLAAGETYSVAVYDSAPLNDKTLEEYLRQFAGPVGKKPGQLTAPLRVTVTKGIFVSGIGTYAGPANSTLNTVFVGVSLNATDIHIMRTLFSSLEVLNRYRSDNKSLIDALAGRAKAEAGGNIARVPEIVGQKIKPGGDLMLGHYVGSQYADQQLRYRLQLDVYAGGEYRLTNHLGDSFNMGSGTSAGRGLYSYNRNSGKLDFDTAIGLENDGDDFCFFGRNSDGKPVIYAEEEFAGRTFRTSLIYVGPTKQLSPSAIAARAAAVEAERNRFKWVTAPGKGVKNAQIEAILFYTDNQARYDGTTDETTHLLLRDGSVYADLPVAPDTLDVVRSKQKEPGKWGKWRLVKGKYQVSWAGAPYQNLPGKKASPAPAQLKLAGRWRASRALYTGVSGSYSEWGVTLNKAGRFKKDSNGGSFSGTGTGDYGNSSVSKYDDEGSSTSVSVPGAMMGAQSKKRNPNGDREGTYSLNGYTLTLRYDNGQVVRLPFFFTDAKRTGLWFEGTAMF